IIECEPHALLPTIPPRLHLLEVDVSGPKNRPYSLSFRFSSSRTTPGSTLTHISSLLISSILLIYLEISAIIPELTTWPARDVPPALTVMLDFSFAANSNNFLISDTPFGQTTATG